MKILGTALLMAVSIGSAAAQGPYRVVDHWTVGGAGGWDYLLADPSAHRLYVTHGPRVEVLDTATGKSVGAITGLKGTHGVALDPTGKFGYVSDGGGNAVVVFDRTTLATVATIAAGTNPDAITFEPTTKTVWAFNGKSRNISVIDSGTNAVVATVEVPGKPEFSAVDGRGSVFVNIETANEMLRLDAQTRKVTATWPLKDCESPTGLAIDREGKRLFSVCDGGKMAVVDAETGKQLASPPIGQGPDAAGYSSKQGLVFSSNGEGTLTVVDARHGYKVLQTLATVKGARTMAYDEDLDRVYLVTAEFGPLPAATAAVPHPRPVALPGSFKVIVVGR